MNPTALQGNEIRHLIKTHRPFHFTKHPSPNLILHSSPHLLSISCVHHSSPYPIKFLTMNVPSFFKPHKPFFRRILLHFTTLASGLVIISCGTSASNFAGKSIQSIKLVTSNLLPSRIPIAEVRTKDLQKISSGTDLALAWDRKLNRWVYTNVDYKPATLPDQQSLPIDGGLLPALHPGRNTTLDGRGSLPNE